MDADRPDERVNWIDLRAGDVRVALGDVARGGSVSRGVVVRSGRPLTPAESAALQAQGFAHVAGGKVYDRPGTRFTRNEMQRAFPRAAVVQVSRRETWDRPPPAPPARPVEAVAPAPVAPPRAAAPLPRPLVLPTPSARPLPPFAQEAPRQAPAPRPELPRPSAEPVRDARAPDTEPARPVPAPEVRKAAPPRPAGPKAAPRQVPVTSPRDAGPSHDEGVPATVGARLNDFQSVYASASRVGEPSAAIPVNLAAPTRTALARLEAERGDIDAYVSKALGWTPERMAQALSPEQVDAVGLALFAAEEGRDFVLADMTGFGKGRVLASIARAMLLKGLNVVFLTEKENLFSDFFRDIADIGSLDAFGRPFIVNDGAEITRETADGREVLFPAMRKAEVQSCIRQATLPKGTRFTMASYSQFNKQGSQKTGFLAAAAKGAHVLLDESHNAVGDSNTSEAIAEAIAEAASVTNSSATFARGAQNLAAYERLFPESMRSSDLMAVLSSGGQALSEALSTMLAESGSYLRREHDMSRIRVEVVEDAKRLERNRAYADALSPVLGGIARLARAVNDVVNERNGPMPEGSARGSMPRGGKELWTAGNFGSRLAAVMRQFVTCLKVEACVEDCVEALSKGVKPVVVIESTMESLMRELSSDAGAPDDEAGDEAPAPAATDGDPAAEAGREPPTFRDALRVFVDRTLTLSVRRHGQPDPEKVPLDDPLLLSQGDEIKRLIDLIPDLTMSPIDDIRARIEGAGRSRGKAWVADEISARSMRVVDGEYVAMPARDRNELVSAFQSGRIDALVITRAASTGLSLHASEKAADKRQRCMIELQIPANVVERMQFFGRVNRRGQVSEPYFRTLSTGLPLENRQLAMQNRKLADLSANVTGAAQNVSAMDVADILDAVGNALCRRFLEDRPTLADRMHIPMRLPDPEKAEGELYHVNKVLQRLCLLPSQEQDALYAQLIKSYEADVRDLVAKGGSISGAKELPGKWRTVSVSTFEAGDPRDGAVFGRPLTLRTLERSETRNPIRSDDLLAMVEEGTARMPRQAGQPFAAEVKAIRQMQPRILLRSLPARFPSVKMALGDPYPNPVKEAERRITELVTLLSVARPGSQIYLNAEEGRERGIVVEVRPPSQEADIATPSMWRLYYALPGREGVQEISAAGVNGDPATTVGAYDGRIPKEMLARFDRERGGETVVRRSVMDGNLVKAVITARHHGWRSAVTWRDEAGTPRRAVLVPKNAEHSLADLPARTTSPEVALAVLNAGGKLRTNRDDPEGGAVVVAENRSAYITIPAKKAAAKQFETPAILRATGGFKGLGQKERYAEPPISRAGDLLRALADAGHAFHFDGQYRDEAGRALASLREPEEDMAPAMAP